MNVRCPNECNECSKKRNGCPNECFTSVLLLCDLINVFSVFSVSSVVHGCPNECNECLPNECRIFFFSFNASATAIVEFNHVDTEGKKKDPEGSFFMYCY